MRVAALVVVVLLAGCASAPPRTAVAVTPPDCPPPPAVPKSPPRIRTTEALRRFEIALELAREAERARGDACAARAAVLERMVTR
jgi:hypothetical protein